ncbi:Carbohydrate kinase PfkB, partial [Corchorus capsularis]
LNGVASGKNSEMLIDFMLPVSDVSLAEAPGFFNSAKGSPTNVAVAISKLGGKSVFIGKLGDVKFGHMLAKILK